MIFAVTNAIYAITYIDLKPENFRTLRYGCDALTNWAIKPLPLSTVHLRFLMSPWGMNENLYMKYFIYWTTDVKSSKLWSSQLWTQCNYAYRSLKNSGLQLNFSGFYIRNCIAFITARIIAYVISHPQFNIWNISYITSHKSESCLFKCLSKKGMFS